jgi:hypothetical protein
MGTTRVARSDQGINQLLGLFTTIAGRPHRPSREGRIL